MNDILTDNLEKKLESLINNELISKSKRGKLADGFKKNKVINEVLDKTTMMIMYNMIKSHIISYVNGVSCYHYKFQKTGTLYFGRPTILKDKTRYKKSREFVGKEGIY